MKHPNAVALAKRLLDSRLKRRDLPQDKLAATNQITDEQRVWALEILSTHIDACMRQGIPTDFSEAVEEALDFAAQHETVYEPIPESARWHSALLMLEEKDEDAESHYQQQLDLAARHGRVCKLILDANDNTPKERLAKAHANRELINVLMAENWLGLRLLTQLNSRAQASASDLASAVGAHIESVKSLLAQLVQFGAVEEQQRSFTCTDRGAKLLQSLEDTISTS